METCKVKHCKNLRHYSDDLFCPIHRDAWRDSTSHLNPDYTEEERSEWIKKFCEA